MATKPARTRGRPPKGSTMDSMAIRLPDEQIREIDDYIVKVKEAWPLLNISRADAIRQLLAAGIAAEMVRMKKK